MNVIRIKARLADGRVLVGPIQGNGGKLGSAALYAGAGVAMQEALGTLARAAVWAAEGRKLPIYEPAPGCVAIYPDFCAETDGEAVAIPLAGTVFAPALRRTPRTA